MGMKKIKNIEFEITYRVSFSDIKVEDDIYDEMRDCYADSSNKECVSDKLSEWFEEHIAEELAKKIEIEIINFEKNEED
jgi:hypothetical protein